MRALFAMDGCSTCIAEVYYIFAWPPLVLRRSTRTPRRWTMAQGARCWLTPLDTGSSPAAEPALEKDAALRRSAANPGTMAVHGS